MPPGIAIFLQELCVKDSDFQNFNAVKPLQVPSNPPRVGCDLVFESHRKEFSLTMCKGRDRRSKRNEVFTMFSFLFVVPRSKRRNEEKVLFRPGRVSEPQRWRVQPDITPFRGSHVRRLPRKGGKKEKKAPTHGFLFLRTHSFSLPGESAPIAVTLLFGTCTPTVLTLSHKWQFL